MSKIEEISEATRVNTKTTHSEEGKNTENSDKNITGGATMKKNKYAHVNLLLVIVNYLPVYHIENCVSLLLTQQMLIENGIQYELYFIFEKEFTLNNRNSAIEYAFSKKDITHILFINSDIQFSQTDILKMINHNKDVMCGGCPQKQYSWPNIISCKKQIENLENLITAHSNGKDDSASRNKIEKLIMNSANSIVSVISSYDVGLNYGVPLKVESAELLKIKSTKFAFVMIKRDVVDHLCHKYKYLKYNNPIKQGSILFDLFRAEVDNNQFIDAEQSFCNKLSNIGCDVYLNININIAIIGNHKYGGNIGEILRAKIGEQHTLNTMNKMNTMDKMGASKAPSKIDNNNGNIEKKKKSNEKIKK